MGDPGFAEYFSPWIFWPIRISIIFCAPWGRSMALMRSVDSPFSADRASIAKNVMSVANAPGTKIYPGELKKGLDLLAKGKKINYEGATGVTFTSVGEAEGSFLEQEIKGGKFKTKKQR